MDFDDTVTNFYKPIADRAGLKLQKLRSGIYEIAGARFIVRLRQGTGHKKDLLVTMAPMKVPGRDLDDLSDEIGLPLIAEFHGIEIPHEDISSNEGFYSSPRRVAETIEQFCIPYLLGRKSDFEELRSFVDRKIEEAGKREWRFPPNVREEWIP
jgi:hypothetical protein